MAGKNKNIAPITSLKTIPEGVSKPGTITSVGTVVTGASTDFKAIHPGFWIYDAAQAEVRRVESVSYSQQVLSIDEPFSADLSAVALVVIPTPEITSLSLFIKAGLADGLVDGNTLPAGLKMFVGPKHGPKAVNMPIDPLVVNGTGTSITVFEVK
tara:strand:- start:821 stop:1285 length:465 start_codon:yes stop_codon:yes gene_type:complete